MTTSEYAEQIGSEKLGAEPSIERLATVRRGANREQHIAIVGAGICGLVAAYELEALGFRTTILEADKTHVGGRVRTMRFDDGTYVEAGAMRIPAEHHLTRAYIAEMGLQLRPFVQSNSSAFIRLRGETRRKADTFELARHFRSPEGADPKDPDAVWEETVSKAVKALSEEELADLYRIYPQTEKIRSFDQLSLVGFLGAQGVSDRSIEYLAGVYGIEAALHISLTEHLREEHEAVWLEKFDEIVGGTDLLAFKLREKIKGNIHLGALVKSISQTQDEVSLGYTKDGVSSSLSADQVIVTAPLPIVRQIEFNPMLSGSKQDAIRRIFYDSSTKVIARTTRRFWEADDGIYGGGSHHDDVLGSVWYPNDNLDEDSTVSEKASAFLASYSWGQLARRVPSQRGQIVEALAELHPSLASDLSQITKLHVWSWDRYPLAQGAYAFFRPGEHSSLFRELVRSEGRVHLAGEHASLAHSWIQGAIESAIHTVKKISEGA